MVFLEELLADGPKSAKEVHAQADEDGVSKSTLNLAKKKMGIKPTQFYKDGKIAGWQWSLPEKPSPEEGDQDED